MAATTVRAGSPRATRPGRFGLNATFVSHRALITRRQIQVVLGLLWFLDGALQLQPFMLGTGFARQVIAPLAVGQPIVVAGPVRWAASIVAAHPLVWDLPFAVTQLVIGLGLLVPRTARLALAVSLPWVLGVWFFGEGLAGLASGHASLLNGAPGAVLLYGVLALAAWPRRDRPDVAPARWLPLAWAVLWVGGAVFQALPGQNTGAAIAGALTGSGSGAPHWLNRLQASIGGWTSHRGAPLVVALIVAEVMIGLTALRRSSRTLAAAAGFVLALAIWVLGQDLGQLYSGQATDPNSGPLIALMAVALIRRREPRDRLDVGR
ncbi:MAG: hypothetical protein JWM72_3983 [Actinomycetia bacterium]|nr:hypothetical protein [Actinomycetes bacterium]